MFAPSSSNQCVRRGKAVTTKKDSESGQNLSLRQIGAIVSLKPNRPGDFLMNG